MEETLRASKGAGLAAPQVGVSDRICLAYIQRKQVALINPMITWKSEEEVSGEEGCLSLPGVWLNVLRAREIVVQFTNFSGKSLELKLKDFEARVIQHEVDHLNGILILDYVPDRAEIIQEDVPKRPVRIIVNEQ